MSGGRLAAIILAATAAVLSFSGAGLGQQAAVQPAGQETIGQPSPFALPGVDQDVFKHLKPYRQKMDRGEVMGYIDWSAREIVAVGKARQEYRSGSSSLMAQRAANVVALRNAMLLAADAPAGPNGKIGNLRDGRVILEGYLKDFKVTRAYSRTLPNGQIWWYAEARVPLFGINGLAVKIYDSQLSSYKATSTGVSRAKWAAPADGEGDLVVIDARGLKFIPGMFLLVISKDGQVLIDMESSDRETAIGVGPCIVASGELSSVVPAKTIAKPASKPSTTSQPAAGAQSCHTVKAVAVKDGSTLILSDDDAARLTADGGASAAIRDGRVIVLVDSESTGAKTIGNVP